MEGRTLSYQITKQLKECGTSTLQFSNDAIDLFKTFSLLTVVDIWKFHLAEFKISHHCNLQMCGFSCDNKVVDPLPTNRLLPTSCIRCW